MIIKAIKLVNFFVTMVAMSAKVEGKYYRYASIQHTSTG